MNAQARVSDEHVGPGVDALPEAGPLLARAVEEAARLLHADGAIVYLVDAEANRLRFAFDAGIREPEAQRLIRDLSLPVGAVRSVVVEAVRSAAVSLRRER